MKAPFVRSAYNYDVDAASKECGVECGESMTKQSFAEEADINVIVKRFGLMGQLPQDVRAPVYGDFTAVTDYRSALQAVRMAAESFMEMPAEVRSRFGNDPAAFVDFCSDAKNAEEMKALGLVDPQVQAASLVAQQTPPAPAGASAPAPSSSPTST